MAFPFEMLGIIAIGPFELCQNLFIMYYYIILTSILFFNILFANMSLGVSAMTFSTADIDLDSMRASASRTCGMLKTLSNPDRLLLLCQISQGERCVSDLEASLDIHQPTLSQQLGVLRDEGLVSTRRDGKRIYYSIASQEALAVMQVLYEQFCGTRSGRARLSRAKKP
jgi:DNA-binding transcriptional ArsR family regulator